MNRRLWTLLISGVIPFLACAPPAPVIAPEADRLTQVSVINALMVGRYDGIMTMGELLRHGDFGVGTLDHLDGEMLVLDGRAYQVRGDGVVLPVKPERTTPFAAVTAFRSEGEFVCAEVAGLTDLESQIDAKLPQKNNFAAVRVEGPFSAITLRSVHRQEPPYRPLAEVAKAQSVWKREGLSGTLVGIRSPAWTGGLNVPGYHWHFLSDNRTVGGHVLDCRATDLRVRFDVCTDWMLKLDGSAGFNATDLSQDLRKDLHRVESSRGEGEPSGKE